MFATLGRLPPRRLEVARKLPRCGEPWEVCGGCASPPQGKKLHSGSEEVVERDCTREGRVERDSRLNEILNGE